MIPVKCPRCELNYILDGEKLCTVCRKEVRGEVTKEDVDLCSECGERPVASGEELCAICLKELGRVNQRPDDEEIVAVSGEEALTLTSVSSMDEIEIEIPPEDEPEDEIDSVFDGEQSEDADEEQ